MIGDIAALRLTDIPLEPLVTVPAVTPLASAALRLARSGLGTVLVETAPLTECTERTLVEALIAGVARDTPIGELALPQPLRAPVEALVGDALAAMLAGGRRSMLVVNGGGTALGFVTLATAIGAALQGAPWLHALKVVLHVEGSELDTPVG